jgi:hypothetical protein
VLLATALCLGLAGCGWVDEQRAEAAADARAETWAEVEETLGRVLGAVERAAGSAERILNPLPVTTPGQEAALRRYLSLRHVDQARTMGIRVRDEEALDSLVDEGRLVRLDEGSDRWHVRDEVSRPAVVPELRALLDTLGARFQRRLAAIGVPAYRIEVTSALRTTDDQARLRGTNSNAAAGVSSHEFGTTVDLSYAAFSPPLEPVVPLPPRDDPLGPVLDRLADLALESVSARKSRELGRIFTEVLLEAQEEGLVLVIYERQQTVWHVTVGPRPPSVVRLVPDPERLDSGDAPSG